MTQSASIHITKLAAAERQLRAAIRMFFSAEDELAVQTVAAAAYRLLSDLKADRGRDEAADNYVMAVLQFVGEYRTGRVPPEVASDADLMKMIEEIDRELPRGMQLTLQNFKATVSEDMSRKFWQVQNRAANFLKHADRDVRAHLTSSELDNFGLIARAISAYVTSAGGNSLGVEAVAFSIYSAAVMEKTKDLVPELRVVADAVKEADASKQLEICSSLIALARRYEGDLRAALRELKL